MSCDNHPGALQYGKGGKIVLTKNDRFRIRNGEILQFVFHALQFKFSKMTFLVADTKHLPKVDDELVQELMREGDTCPIEVGDREISILNSNRVLSRDLPCKPVFQIIVCTSQQMHKKSMEKNESL